MILKQVEEAEQRERERQKQAADERRRERVRERAKALQQARQAAKDELRAITKAWTDAYALEAFFTELSRRAAAIDGRDERISRSGFVLRGS